MISTKNYVRHMNNDENNNDFYDIVIRILYSDSSKLCSIPEILSSKNTFESFFFVTIKHFLYLQEVKSKQTGFESLLH